MTYSDDRVISDRHRARELRVLFPLHCQGVPSSDGMVGVSMISLFRPMIYDDLVFSVTSKDFLRRVMVKGGVRVRVNR